jgi:hypothetical protein
VWEGWIETISMLHMDAGRGSCREAFGRMDADLGKDSKECVGRGGAGLSVAAEEVSGRMGLVCSTVYL